MKVYSMIEDNETQLIKWGFGEPPLENRKWEGFSIKTRIQNRCLHAGFSPSPGKTTSSHKT